jgi:hypothetical protein
LFWFGLLILAIINGTIRDYTYLKSLGEYRAHQLSTITLLILMSIYCLIIFSNWRLTSSNEAITVGIIWLLLTLAFEFLFGHFVGGHSWEKLIAQYNIFSGNLWVLIVIWTALLPLVCYKIFENQT